VICKKGISFFSSTPVFAYASGGILKLRPVSEAQLNLRKQNELNKTARILHKYSVFVAQLT
jgi:hypothetical protein